MSLALVTRGLVFKEPGLDYDNIVKYTLSYDVASGSEITPYHKIDKPLVVFRLTGNVMTS